MRKLLKNYTIIDWSSHLPGPYACHLLAEMGANIIKFAPKDKKMPFQRFPKEGPLELFDHWYQKLNSQKTTKEFDSCLFSEANGVITNQDYDFPKNLIVTKIKASLNDDIPRHDLNVLAESNFLKHHTHLFGEDKLHLSPPSLPWAGIMLSQHIVQTHLSQHLSDTKEVTVSLKECFENITSDLLPSSLGTQEFLHSGAFACYRLYRLGSGKWVALAAIEGKYWGAFLNYYQLGNLDRFDHTGKVIKRISEMFQNIDDIDESITLKFCLNLV